MKLEVLWQKEQDVSTLSGQLHMLCSILLPLDQKETWHATKEEKMKSTEKARALVITRAFLFYKTFYCAGNLG
jgi:hypothetical protein